MDTTLILWMLAAVVSLASLIANVVLRGKIRRDIEELRTLNMVLGRLVELVPPRKPAQPPDQGEGGGT